MTDIRRLAGEIGTWPAAEIGQWPCRLVDAGEDRALSRLLQVCAFNKVKLNAEVLVTFGLRELAFDLLLECERRLPETEFRPRTKGRSSRTPA